MFKARGQPGCWFGYVTIEGITYKIDARHVGQKTAKHFIGTVKRHLKADQRPMIFGPQRPPTPAESVRELAGAAINAKVDRLVLAEAAQDIFDDELPPL
jgi:hypothetical protein